MSKNLILEFEIKKNCSPFRGDISLSVSEYGIACTVRNSDYENAAETTIALRESITALLRIGTKDFISEKIQHIPSKHEAELLVILTDHIEQTAKLQRHKNN